jgi:hypothetical protein
VHEGRLSHLRSKQVNIWPTDRIFIF